jgi:hypothetical protein
VYTAYDGIDIFNGAEEMEFFQDGVGAINIGEKSKLQGSYKIEVG